MGCEAVMDSPPLPRPPTVPGFTDLEFAGEGGFSVVYRAEQEHVGRLVAVKVLTGLNTDDQRSKDRFLREVRFMGRLDQIDNIVDIYVPVFSEEGWPCIVMPYMAGGSLAARIDSEGPLPVNQVLELGEKIARALGKAHLKGEGAEYWIGALTCADVLALGRSDRRTVGCLCLSADHFRPNSCSVRSSIGCSSRSSSCSWPAASPAGCSKPR